MRSGVCSFSFGAANRESKRKPSRATVGSRLRFDGRLSRHLTIYTISPADDEGVSGVVSALQVFRTELDGGATALFAVGKVHDRVRFVDGRAWLVSRRVRLDTRMLGIGSHIPF